MAMNITLADNADVTPYEGENIDVSWTDTERNEVGLQAEAYLCCLLKYDVVTNWGTLNAVYKIMLTEYVARNIAVAGILFNTEGYTSRVEAEDMANVSIFRIDQIHKLLEDPSVQDFMGV